MGMLAKEVEVMRMWWVGIRCQCEKCGRTESGGLCKNDEHDCSK